MDNLAHKPSRLQDNLDLSGRRSHVVIALLPFLEAQGAVEYLDVEDAKLALQLEADDEGRRQAVELGEAPPSAEELRLPAS